MHVSGRNNICAEKRAAEERRPPGKNVSRDMEERKKKVGEENARARKNENRRKRKRGAKNDIAWYASLAS
jgi:hypothetical protein